MISCAQPSGGVLPAPGAADSHWNSLLHTAVKQEQAESGGEHAAYSKDSGGFMSDGFHSASPTSSAKDSPRSVASDPFYDPLPIHGKINIGLHLDPYHQSQQYNLSTPPGYDAVARLQEPNNPSPYYNSSFSPKANGKRQNQMSTPISATNAPSPKSPIRLSSSPDQNESLHQHYDQYCDSGYQNVSNQSNVKAEPSPHEDNESRDGSVAEEMDYEDEPGLRVPAVNSHGKVKTFKCKQCEFVAVTKLSFWEHTKEHIKPEKMLTCPKCPFVTEYKHHLEYHMRNHFGSKPFQCNQCNYSCVNKSMLNSHLKSHSNIYQYRCSDCNYATKYCHSLKLHLRKYQHSPAMVLNQDGTPNPLPIIDVYGTRRGPKQKSMSKPAQESPTSVASGSQPHPLFQNPFALNFPYPPLLPHPFLFPGNNGYGDAPSAPPIDSDKSPTKTAKQFMDQNLSSQILQHRLIYGESNPSHYLARNPASRSVSPPPVSSPKKMATPRTPERSPPISPRSADDALDLTNSKPCNASTPPPLNNSTPLTPTASLKNRRKGRAFKLESVALRMQHSSSEEDLSKNACRSSPAVKTSDSEDSNGSAETIGKDINHNKKCQDSGYESECKRNEPHYDCQYCDISFKDLTMHTIHMGFHGYNDPFMCNKCGERSVDKVSFFIHLGRAQHS